MAAAETLQLFEILCCVLGACVQCVQCVQCVHSTIYPVSFVYRIDKQQPTTAKRQNLSLSSAPLRRSTLASHRIASLRIRSISFFYSFFTFFILARFGGGGFPLVRKCVFLFRFANAEAKYTIRDVDLVRVDADV